jgi:Protein of unknown function (DUF3754)
MTHCAGDDGFIPARKGELLAAIRADGAPAGLEDVLTLLSALMRHEAQDALDTLRDLYEPLDPDAHVTRHDTGHAAFDKFEAALNDVLTKANFREIEPDTVETRAATRLLTGLHVKASLAGIRRIRYYARGSHMENFDVKAWLGLRKKKIDAEVLNDTVVVVSFKSDSEIERADKKAFAAMRRGVRPGAALIKHFRNMASAELVTLHPGATCSMRPHDQFFLAAPALAGGVPVLINLWPALTVLFAVLAAYFGAHGAIEDSDLKRAIAAISGLVAVGAFVGRQWMKYERQTLKYQKQLADTVYFRNIANNVGVLDLLVGAGADQDVREAIIAYWMLVKADAPMTKEAIDAAAEAFLREKLSLSVDFEIGDALAKLERLGLVTRLGEAYAPISVADARVKLDARWDGLFSFAPAPA